MDATHDSTSSGWYALGGYNLAVNGADVASLVRERADADSPAQINSETDLILFPRKGSQMEGTEGLSHWTRL